MRGARIHFDFRGQIAVATVSFKTFFVVGRPLYETRSGRPCNHPVCPRSDRLQGDAAAGLALRSRRPQSELSWCGRTDSPRAPNSPIGRRCLATREAWNCAACGMREVAVGGAVRVVTFTSDSVTATAFATSKHVV